jgi:hypothetical protein
LCRQEPGVSEGALLIVLYPWHQIFASLTEQNINVSQSGNMSVWVNGRRAPHIILEEFIANRLNPA